MNIVLDSLYPGQLFKKVFGIRCLGLIIGVDCEAELVSMVYFGFTRENIRSRVRFRVINLTTLAAYHEPLAV